MNTIISSPSMDLYSYRLPEPDYNEIAVAAIASIMDYEGYEPELDIVGIIKINFKMSL